VHTFSGTEQHLHLAKAGAYCPSVARRLSFKSAKYAQKTAIFEVIKN